MKWQHHSALSVCLASKLAAELFPARKGAEAITRPRAAAARDISRALPSRYMVPDTSCLLSAQNKIQKATTEGLRRTCFADYVAHAVQFVRLAALRQRPLGDAIGPCEQIRCRGLGM